MRRTAETLVRSVFRSRWVLAVALVVIIVAIVTLARLLAGPAPGRMLDSGNQPAPTISTDPHGDDSILSPAPPPPPSVSPGTAEPTAVAYAFASAWADHQGVSGKQWLDRLLPHSTEALAKKLSDTDPAVIPADHVTGQPVLTPLGDQVAEVKVGTDSGDLVLRLVAPDGRWLVDAVDWQRL
jgi:hypothetical protein